MYQINFFFENSYNCLLMVKLWDLQDNLALWLGTVARTCGKPMPDIEVGFQNARRRLVTETELDRGGANVFVIKSSENVKNSYEHEKV